MSVIYKKQLGLGHDQLVMLPKRSIILTAREQYDKPTVWYVCDPEENLEPYYFSVYATGEEVDRFSGEYIGTCFCHATSDTMLVWHVYVR